MKKLSVSNAIVAALNKLGSASTKSLTSHTKKPYAQVATALWKLKNDGKVTLENGVYTLSADNKSKTPKTLKVPMKLEGAPVQIDDLEKTEEDELFAMTAEYMGKYLDSQAVIRYLESKLAQRDVNA